MKRNWLAAAFTLIPSVFLNGQLSAHDAERHLRITSFTVDDFDTALTYPSYLLDIPDEHVTFLPFWARPFPLRGPDADSYLLFASSKVSPNGTGGAVVLQTSDLIHFFSTTLRGYAEQVMAPPLPINVCDGTHNQEFDENYAAPGSVLQDPTLPPGNLIMIYEAENHCPGGVNQHFFYATVGFARSSDGGRTWPAPVNSEFGNAQRHPVLKGAVPEPPSTSSSPLGDAIPSGFVDINDRGEAYLYVTYGYHDGHPADQAIRVARAKLGDVRDPDNDRGGQLQFYKWYNGAFSQPGIGGLDSGVLPAGGCPGFQQMSEITYNDDLGQYLMVFVCNPSSPGHAAWYYATATNLELQDWTTPQPIVNSELPVTSPCNTNDTTGAKFDGFYPSFMSPRAAAGHTRLTGRAFFLNGCDTGLPRAFASRGFKITVEPYEH